MNYIASEGVKGAVAAKGGFVKEAVTYMVTDDLVVKPMSPISSITLLNKFNVKNVGVLQPAGASCKFWNGRGAERIF
ncbi:hypothetical protein MTR67_028724 [Solanum verrucosum]|uniref:Uncharacterized protein n=1 Tax=Solanum verrucosum TaxID=315347 RepID=A0AAF0R2Z1_SOLVR|nr:hypothetical protein MTR67_028724 [Solanum verrucosum]